MITGAVVLSFLLGAPVTGALTAVQIASLAGMGAQAVPQAVGAVRFLESPTVRAWAAANGEQAIRLQPGIISER